MNCTRPLQVGEVSSHGCGQCLPCRINQSRLWAHRIYLESLQHVHSTIITLTYELEPQRVEWRGEQYAAGSLCPDDLRRFLKRLRKVAAPQRLRFFACAEYGDQRLRPHYHVAVFGLALPPDHDRFAYPCHCATCSLVREAWKGPADEDGRVRGFVLLDRLTWEAAAYVAGYVTKKVNGKHRPGPGFYPEFARMSTHPGIGAGAALAIAASLADSVGQAYLQRAGDVPFSVHSRGKKLPLGRYLRNVVRRELGRDEKTPQAVLDQKAKEVFALFEAEGRSKVLAQAEMKRRVLADQTVKRHRIFASKGSL